MPRRKTVNKTFTEIATRVQEDGGGTCKNDVPNSASMRRKRKLGKAGTRVPIGGKTGTAPQKSAPTHGHLWKTSVGGRLYKKQSPGKQKGKRGPYEKVQTWHCHKIGERAKRGKPQNTQKETTRHNLTRGKGFDKAMDKKNA